MYDIFASDVVEDDVKKAAVDQLGIMLQGKEVDTFFKTYLVHAFLWSVSIFSLTF